MEKIVHTFPPEHGHEAGHDHETHGSHEHHGPGFWGTYIFSPDHKVIGLQYGLTSLAFLLFGFFLMLMMRWQISKPGVPVPLLGPLLE